jgi:carboxypeptidase PM20D1
LTFSVLLFLDVRVAPHDSVEAVVENFKYYFNDPEIELTILDPLQPSPYTSMDSFGYRTIEKAIRTVWPRVPVAPGLTVGNTDTRHFWEISDSILRFSPIYLHKTDVARMHGLDERIGVDVYKNNIDFYYHLIKNM